MSVYKNNSNYDDKEKKFDNFLNKTIIMSSKKYFKKEANINRKEQSIIDNEDFCAILDDLNMFDDSSFDAVDRKLQLHNAVKTLSVVEQAVIFLLFNEELSQEEAAKILEICSKSVSRIKLRAIRKLKKYLEGDAK